MYSFNWHKENHLEFQKQNIWCSRELWRYLNRISKGDFPQQYFNDDKIQRISSFKINGLNKGIVPSIGREFINRNIIKEVGKEYILVSLSSKVFENFVKAKINRIPNHDVILRNILLKDENSIAKEIPIWMDPPNTITGHIDLIRISNNILEVADYKPEGNFMRSIPQVAFYGYLLAKKFGLDSSEINCISFNRELAWIYNPFIIFEELNTILKGVWNNYLK